MGKYRWSDSAARAQVIGRVHEVKATQGPRRACGVAGVLLAGTPGIFCQVHCLGARLRGRTATQRSEKGSGKGFGEGVLRRVLRRGPAMGFTVKKGSEKGSQKGF